jgi:hypothetical protein
LGQVATNIFRKIRNKRLDSPVNKPPDGQITRLCRSICPPVTWLDHGSAIRILRSVADRRTHSMKKPQVSLPDLVRQSIFLPRLMDTRVILREDALRAFARV